MDAVLWETQLFPLHCSLYKYPITYLCQSQTLSIQNPPQQLKLTELLILFKTHGACMWVFRNHTYPSNSAILI